MKNKKGISLIVLVITIIVMIILASAIIISLSNTDIIGRAEKAKSAYEMSQAQMVAMIGYSEAYASGLRTEQELKEATLQYMQQAGLKSDEYGIIITEGKIIVTDLSTGKWVRNGLTVTKGTQTLSIGDKVNYKANASDTNEWRVVGVGEGGELLVTTLETQKAGQIKLGSATDVEKAKQDYINAVSILNAACAEYGTGEGAIYVRSIRADDINTLVGYTLGSQMSDYEGKVTEYGNTVTFTQETPSKILGDAANGADIEYSGDNSHEANGFTDFDVATNKFTVLKGSSYNGKVLGTLTNSMYVYYTNTYTGWAASSATEHWKTIFTGTARVNGEPSPKAYWLADRYVKVDTDHVSYGVKLLEIDYLGNQSFVRSKGTSKEMSHGVKPIVGIDPSYEISKVD